MRPLLLAVTAIALATPAFAQDTTTLDHVTTRGIVLSAGGMEVDVSYKPDGSFTAMDGQVTGKWRVEGGKVAHPGGLPRRAVIALYAHGLIKRFPACPAVRAVGLGVLRGEGDVGLRAA